MGAGNLLTGVWHSGTVSNSKLGEGPVGLLAARHAAEILPLMLGGSMFRVDDDLRNGNMECFKVSPSTFLH